MAGELIGRCAVVKTLSKSRGAPPKNLIHYPSMQYLKDKLKDSGDLLSYSFVQISVGMEKTMAAANKKKR